MLPIFSNVRLFLYSTATDMRKSFDGLCGIINNSLKKNPLSGDVYIFINRRKDRIKLLVWDRDGFWLFYKRLEKGVFQLPLNLNEHTSVQLSQEDLLLILQGIDLNYARKRPRYHRP